MLTAFSYSRLNVQFLQWLPFLLAASIFAVPISSTAKGVFVGLAVAFVVFTPAYYRELRLTLSQPWCQALLVFFFVILLACAWGPASVHDKTSVLKKYSKLLFLPFLVVGFRDQQSRRMGLYAYLAAMFITCVLSMLKGCGVLTYNGPDPGQVFHNHIMTGLMMAFATYLSAWLLIQEKTTMGRALYVALVLLFSYQILFISTGRTGYVIYGMLMFLLVMQTLPWRKAVLALVLGCLLLPVSYYQSPTMQLIVNNAIENVRDIKHGNKNNSIGYRIQFHAFAKKLFLQHPWFGNGTGSYSYLFKQDNPVPAWHDVRPSQKNMFEPHSQYWLVAAELGLIGIFSLLLFFGSLVVAALRLHSMRAIAIALLIPFMVGNLSDSLLFYSGTGYFFLLFMAMCLSEQPSVVTR